MHSVVTRMLVGGFVAPESYGENERLVVNSWLVRHPDATILVDTGLAEGLPAEDVEKLKIIRTPIVDALAGIGVRPDEIEVVINCHLHADHAGGNREFRDARFLVQPAEVEAAHDTEYTVADAVDLDGLQYEPHEGEHEPLPGIRIVPTSGHSPGHQSIAIDTDV